MNLELLCIGVERVVARNTHNVEEKQRTTDENDDGDKAGNIGARFVEYLRYDLLRLGDTTLCVEGETK